MIDTEKYLPNSLRKGRVDAFQKDRAILPDLLLARAIQHKGISLVSFFACSTL